MFAVGCATAAPAAPSLRATGGAPLHVCTPACAPDEQCREGGCTLDPSEVRERLRRRGLNAMIVGGALVLSGAIVFGTGVAAAAHADVDDDLFPVAIPVGGGVLGAIGAATLAAGGVFWARAEAPPRATVRLRPALRRGHVGLGLTVEF